MALTLKMPSSNRGEDVALADDQLQGRSKLAMVAEEVGVVASEMKSLLELDAYGVVVHRSQCLLHWRWCWC